MVTQLAPIETDGDGFRWFDATAIGLQGRAFERTAHAYDRLPARAQDLVTSEVWRLSHHTTGMRLTFSTNASEIRIRCTYGPEQTCADHLSLTGAAAFDLYAQTASGWTWAGITRHPTYPEFTAPIIQGASARQRTYMLYLPIAYSIACLAVGIPAQADLCRGDADRKKPMCFYGTSIVHGRCVSRPGMTYPAILGRRFNQPFYNFGFAGNGPMHHEVAELLAELDVSLFVIDSLPNMDAPLVRERAAEFVRILRRACPSPPIALVECVRYANECVLPQKREHRIAKDVALREAYERLLSEGVNKLCYIPGERLLGHDGEATVDSTHPTDLGFVRMADEIGRHLLPWLEDDASLSTAGERR
jgi:hypothetical protein